MLTMEDAAKALFPSRDDLAFQALAGLAASPAPHLSSHISALALLGSDPRHEDNRRRVLGYAAQALAKLEQLGLCCGVFGSALRPGDFFYSSDVDIAAWLPGASEPIPRDLSLSARFACHECLFGSAFDLVLLPCSNEPFGERILNGWTRGRADVELASQGLPMSSPVDFGPMDVAFIDQDRLRIALAAAERVAKAASGAEPESERSALSICSSIQTIVRVAEKCAKDALRELAKISPPTGVVRPLYPLLAYPSSSLGGVALASEQALALYFECRRHCSPPPNPSARWAGEAALLATLFARQLHDDFAPGLEAMRMLDPRASSQAAAPLRRAP